MYSYKALVQNVVDGDTVDISIDLGFDIWHNIRVRLTGIDTPEKWYDYGKVVKKYVMKKLENQEVTIATEKADKYGRYLVDVYLKDETESFNMHLVKVGMAKQYGGASRAELWTEEELNQTTHPLLLTT